MSTRIRIFGAIGAVAFLAFVIPSSAYADTCPTGQTTALTDSQRAQCEADLAQVEAEEAQAESQLSQAQSQSASLQKDINVLDAKIKAEQLDIQAKNLLIQTLGGDITDKQNHINDLEDQITQGKQTLADLLRKTNELDSYSLPEVLLSQSTVTGFFGDIDTFGSLEGSLQSVFEQLQTDEASTSAEKDALTTQQDSAEDARYAIQQDQQSVKADEAQQEKLLAVSKGNENSYSTLVTQEDAKAAQIRAALFTLAGTTAIPFGDALNYATTVYKATGVPPAFLLAILKQETGIGSNVGTCYLTDTADGSGINAKNNTAVADVMKPSRDVQPFLAITSSLGLDYHSMPVSCPQSIGYGGGMGPAQFIASTWTLLISRIASAIGVSVPNPWKPLDAFTAAGLYLADLGADSSSYTSQRTAACKYYSGTTCYNAVTGRANVGLSYGNSVMALAASIQTNQIDPLQGL